MLNSENPVSSKIPCSRTTRAIRVAREPGQNKLGNRGRGTTAATSGTTTKRAVPSFPKGTIIQALLALLATTVPIVAVSAPLNRNCINADPSSVVANVNGDYEIIADPEDPAGNLIFTSNVESGPSSVVVARMNGQTGQVMSGSLSTIANNFSGQTVINGPEFVEKSTGELGLIYAGGDGVHGVFRQSAPVAWNDFNFDVTGVPTNGSPPALPSTSAGAYPGPPPPLEINTYGQALGSCQGSGCFGALGAGVYTDVFAAMAAQGLSSLGATMSPRDGYIFIGACTASNICGLYEGLIDGNGGFVAGSLNMLAPVSKAPVYLSATRHPVTGTTVLFSNDQGSSSVDVWEQPAAGGALNLIGKVPVPASTHYRTEGNTTEVVLDYLYRTAGTPHYYTIPVTANGNTLVVGSSSQISTFPATEFDWMPAANRWAIFYRPSPGQLTRCWVTP